MPIVTDGDLSEFNYLCEEYSIPGCDLKTNSGPISLLNIFMERSRGGFRSRLEILEDPFPFSEIASLILQLGEGDIVKVISRESEQSYKGESVSIMKEALIIRLYEKVLRYGSRLFLRKGVGPDGLFEVNKTDDAPDFSNEELNAIIAADNKLRHEVVRLSGDAERKVHGIEPRKGKRTRRPDLGESVRAIIDACENDVEWPQNLSLIQKYAFIFDFMKLCGYFEDKNPEWLEETDYYNPTEKYQYITNLLKQ